MPGTKAKGGKMAKKKIYGDSLALLEGTSMDTSQGQVVAAKQAEINALKDDIKDYEQLSQRYYDEVASLRQQVADLEAQLGG